jgi:hypothetical protein
MLRLFYFWENNLYRYFSLITKSYSNKNYKYAVNIFMCLLNKLQNVNTCRSVGLFSSVYSYDSSPKLLNRFVDVLIWYCKLRTEILQRILFLFVSIKYHPSLRYSNWNLSVSLKWLIVQVGRYKFCLKYILIHEIFKKIRGEIFMIPYRLTSV